MEIGISYVCGYGPFLAPDVCSNGRLGLHFEVRHHQVPIQCRQIDDGTQIPSSSAPGTAGCRTRETTRWELFLWLPWTAGPSRPAGDPDSCSWCRTRCCDGWVGVVVESANPPLPRQCWWPGKLRHWWAKPARRAPTCYPSATACRRSMGSSFGLPSVGYIGTVLTSPARASKRAECLGWWSSKWLMGGWKIPNGQKLTSWPADSCQWRSSYWPGLMLGPWSLSGRSQMNLSFCQLVRCS